MGLLRPEGCCAGSPADYRSRPRVAAGSGDRFGHRALTSSVPRGKSQGRITCATDRRRRCLGQLRCRIGQRRRRRLGQLRHHFGQRRCLLGQHQHYCCCRRRRLGSSSFRPRVQCPADWCRAAGQGWCPPTADELSRKIAELDAEQRMSTREPVPSASKAALREASSLLSAASMVSSP